MIRSILSIRPWLAMIALGIAVALYASRTAGAQNPVAFDLSAPKLHGEANDWLNTGGKDLTFAKGKVYVVEFWTFG